MNVLLEPMTLWLVITAAPLTLVVLLGLAKVRLCRCSESPELGPFPAAEILIPIKGIAPDQESILESLLAQRYPNYWVTFIVESQNDPVNSLLERLCTRYPHAGVVVSQLATGCAQKNQNLVAGLRALKPATEIVVFCDSSNFADPDWLARFTGPLRRGKCQVQTTFRAFRPEPETMGGVGQAIYAAFVLTLALVNPKPWGGGTAIRREVLDRLNVVEIWSHTVVDDLVLGNLLDSTGIKIRMDPGNILTSPLKKQSISGFLGYLDRQILFPKFTNPGIWVATLIFHLNLTIAICVTALAGIAYLLGVVSNSAGLASWLFLGNMVLVGFVLRSVNRFAISIRGWLLGFLPCVFLAAFVLLRSIFRNYIDWHGRRYYPGKDGLVLDTRLVKP
jgi:ceramide glucosyltransferase